MRMGEGKISKKRERGAVEIGREAGENRDGRRREEAKATERGD